MKDADKIEHALDTCVAYALNAERPFQEAADFLMLLRRSEEWSDAEISKVQTLALTALIRRATDKPALLIDNPTSKAVKPQNASTLSDARYGTILDQLDPSRPDAPNGHGERHAALVPPAPLATMDPMPVNQPARQSTAQILRWELAWLCVEILGVSAGLWLTLSAAPVQLGGTVLFFVCMVSLLVRMQHYSSLKGSLGIPAPELFSGPL